MKLEILQIVDGKIVELDITEFLGDKEIVQPNPYLCEFPTIDCERLR